MSVITAIGCIIAAAAQCTATASEQPATYVAELHPLNSAGAGGQTTGEARFTVNADTLTISIAVKGAPPGIEHWQHFHGFKDGRPAACPTTTADRNHDGVIDLIETEPSSGTTMVPFNDAPAAMEIPNDTYPKASANGTYNYSKTVSLAALTAAFKKAFPGQELALDHRVVFIHGVPATARLPASAASLGPIPAHVTLPIACGKIERLEK